MLHILDNREAMRRLDPDGMLDCIGELPRQCTDAWSLLAAQRLPQELAGARNIVISGMGGSAIGAEMVQGLAVAEASAPITVWRNYDLPAWAGQDTLVICSSFSGNTEETLSSFQAAIARGCKLLAITTGGEMRERATKCGVPTLCYDCSGQPRAALGYSATLILGVLCQLGYLGDKSAELGEAVGLLEAMTERYGPDSPADSNLAKQFALLLHGHLPIVYGGGILAPVARRWKGQFNENSKSWAFYEELPELHHNAVVGYEHCPAMAPLATVIILHSKLNHERIRLRCRITEDILHRRGIAYRVVEAEGESPLAQVMTTAILGDYTSFYLAMLNGADPTPVEVISYIKKRLQDA